MPLKSLQLKKKKSLVAAFNVEFYVEFFFFFRQLVPREQRIGLGSGASSILSIICTALVFLDESFFAPTSFAAACN